MSQRVTLQPAFVLHSRPFGDTSAIIDLIARDYGRLPVMARGLRRPASRWRGLLRAFEPLAVSWSGKADFPTLTDVERSAAGGALSGDALACGLYLNELLMRLLPRHDPCPGIFENYAATLPVLVQPVDRNRALRLFEKRLLDALGYGLLLAHEAGTGSPIEHDVLYRYEVESGPVRSRADRRDGHHVHGHTLYALAREEFPDDRALHESKQLMRVVLSHYLGERPLHSRALFR